MLVLLKFFCQIISVDAKSLVTSFNISGVALQLLGLNILDMNHDPTVLQFLTNLRYLEVLAPPAWLLSASGSWVLHEMLPYQILLLVGPS